LAVGQSFGSFSPRGARSKGDQQPDGRVAHNQKLQNILSVDIGILATQVLRARKTRKMLVGSLLSFHQDICQLPCRVDHSQSEGTSLLALPEWRHFSTHRFILRGFGPLPEWLYNTLFCFVRAVTRRVSLGTRRCCSATPVRKLTSLKDSTSLSLSLERAHIRLHLAN
jgi:hypothetical protein